MKTLMISLLILIVCTSFAFATDLEGYTFLKISGSDARAVVETPQGEKQLVSPGDMLGKARVTEITENRVMLERPSKTGPEVLIVRLKNGKQKIDRLQKMPVKRKVVVAEPDKASAQFGY